MLVGEPDTTEQEGTEQFALFSLDTVSSRQFRGGRQDTDPNNRALKGNNRTVTLRAIVHTGELGSNIQSLHCLVSRLRCVVVWMNYTLGRLACQPYRAFRFPFFSVKTSLFFPYRYRTFDSSAPYSTMKTISPFRRASVAYFRSAMIRFLCSLLSACIISSTKCPASHRKG